MNISKSIYLQQQNQKIMQNSSYKDEGVMAEQLSQPQPPLSGLEMSNKQAVQKTIKKYQTKISELLIIIQKQKKQNQGLKQDLISLNDSLNNVISKVGHRGHKPAEEASRDDVVRKQLDTEIKKNVALQKQVSQLRTRVKVINASKLTEMHNQLKDKDKKIDQLNSSIKTYAKAATQQKNMDIYRREEQMSHKVTLLNQELLHLRKRVNQQKKHQEIQEKSLKRQHQQIIGLETKYKTVQNGGVSPGVFKRREETSPPTHQLQKLKDNFQTLESTKKAGEKHFRHQLDSYKLRIRVLEKDLEEANDSLSRKEKEINIIAARMRDLQRKRDHKTLEPVEIGRKSQDFSVSGLFDQRKEFKGLAHIQGNYRKFDDTGVLTLEKNYKIKKLVFTWFEQHILSLDTVYEMHQGTEKDVASFRVTHSYQNIKFGELNFAEFEYIKDIEVFCGKWIQFIRITTSREQVLEIGSDRNYTKCKKFTFDIRTNEKPIAFLGAIQNKKNLGSQGKELLISFGLEIKKKQVSGRSVKFGGRHPGRTDSIRKYPSKSVYEHSSRNDKNIIEEND